MGPRGQAAHRPASAAAPVVAVRNGRPVPVVFSTNTVTNATNRNYAVTTYMALASSERAQVFAADALSHVASLKSATFGSCADL